jgi:hypothetical protein
MLGNSYVMLEDAYLSCLSDLSMIGEKYQAKWQSWYNPSPSPFTPQQFNKEKGYKRTKVLTPYQEIIFFQYSHTKYVVSFSFTLYKTVQRLIRFLNKENYFVFILDTHVSVQQWPLTVKVKGNY